MERYLTLLIVVTLIGLMAMRKEGQQECDLSRQTQQERKAATALATFETDANYPLILTSYTQFAGPGADVCQNGIYDSAVCKNNIQQMIKNCRGGVDQPRKLNPRALFNILRSLRLGEPYLIQ
jgi:hypothetical protein